MADDYTLQTRVKPVEKNFQEVGGRVNSKLSAALANALIDQRNLSINAGLGANLLQSQGVQRTQVRPYVGAEYGPAYAELARNYDYARGNGWSQPSQNNSLTAGLRGVLSGALNGVIADASVQNYSDGGVNMNANYEVPQPFGLGGVLSGDVNRFKAPGQSADVNALLRYKLQF